MAKQNVLRNQEGSSLLFQKKREKFNSQNLKELFLSKHIKKEFSTVSASPRLQIHKSPSRSNYYELNPNGYVQQSFKKRSSRGSKKLAKELLQLKDFAPMKRNSGHFFKPKLV